MFLVIIRKVLVLFLIQGYILSFHSQLLFALGIIPALHSKPHLKKIKSRRYNASGKEAMILSVISSLEELGFIVKNGDILLGNVIASKPVHNDILEMKVAVTKIEERTFRVNTTINYGAKEMEELKPYTDFFKVLSKRKFPAR